MVRKEPGSLEIARAAQKIRARTLRIKVRARSANYARRLLISSSILIWTQLIRRSPPTARLANVHRRLAGALA